MALAGCPFSDEWRRRLTAHVRHVFTQNLMMDGSDNPVGFDGRGQNSNELQHRQNLRT